MSAPPPPPSRFQLDRGNLLLVLAGAVAVLVLTLAAAVPDARRVSELMAISDRGRVVPGIITAVAETQDYRGEAQRSVTFRFTPLEASSSPVLATLEPASASWRVGTRVQVRYLPGAPQQAFIEGYRATDVLARLFGSLMLLLLVLAGLGLTWREWRARA